MLKTSNKIAAPAMAAVLAVGAAGCFDATQNPVAALSAVEKITVAISAIDGGADPFSAAKAAVDQLSASELASAANIVGGLDLSLQEAEDIIALVEQVDESTLAQLEAADIDISDPNNAPEDVADALSDAGVENVTADDVALLYELLEIFNQ